jgi:TetR/AcrR family tetracycline transcriptional repressor
LQGGVVHARGDTGPGRRDVDRQRAEGRQSCAAAQSGQDQSGDARLGIKSPSLYWHVKGKEQLFALVIDHVVGQCALPARSIGWRAQLDAIGHGLRRALIAHPAAPQLLLGRPIFGPNGLRLTDHVIGALRDHGFTDKLASYGYIVFINYVIGFASQETAFGKGPHQRLDRVESFLATLPADQYPDLTAVAAEFVAGQFTARFDLGLSAILDRLAADAGAQ